jgi:hypothetical protein
MKASINSIILALTPMTTACLHNFQGYWTYEYCHKNHAHQIHILSNEEEQLRKLNPSKHLDLYILGKSSKLISMKIMSNAVGDGDFNISFFRLVIGFIPSFFKYRGGTTCDITGEPRITEIDVFCFSNNLVSLFISV